MRLEKIRLATEEEIKKIADVADLTPFTKVVAMGDILAAWRAANEIDPVIFPEGLPNNQKYLFMWGMENVLRGAGLTEYYFNVSAKDNQWKQIVEHFGAKPVSKEPEIRYKVTL